MTQKALCGAIIFSGKSLGDLNMWTPPEHVILTARIQFSNKNRKNLTFTVRM